MKQKIQNKNGGASHDILPCETAEKAKTKTGTQTPKTQNKLQSQKEQSQCVPECAVSE